MSIIIVYVVDDVIVAVSLSLSKGEGVRGRERASGLWVLVV